MVRIYTYRFTPPGDPLTLATAIRAVGVKLTEFNENVIKVDTAMDGDDMLMHVWFQGIDQWMIKKKIVYPVAGIMTKVGIHVKDIKLEAVDKPPDARRTRPRASDGSHLPPDPDEMIDHSDMGLPA